MNLKVPHVEHASFVAEHFASESRRHFDYDLDFSIESIDLIDKLVGGTTKTEDPGKNEFIYNLLVHVGCYVGEVMIRSFGGTWQDTTSVKGFPLGIMSTGSDPTLYLNSIGKVIKRYEEGKEHDLKTFVVSQALFMSSFGLNPESQ